MTATPIPRTVALTMFGDLDTIDHPRAAAGPATGHDVADWTRSAIASISAWPRNCARAGKRYVVCPLVEETEKLDLEAAEETLAELRDGPFREFRLGLLHGRMDDDAKDQVMNEFRAGRIDSACGHARDRSRHRRAQCDAHGDSARGAFGLSQLHQMRAG